MSIVYSSRMIIDSYELAADSYTIAINTIVDAKVDSHVSSEVVCVVLP